MTIASLLSFTSPEGREGGTRGKGGKEGGRDRREGGREERREGGRREREREENVKSNRWESGSERGLTHVHTAYMQVKVKQVLI